MVILAVVGTLVIGPAFSGQAAQTHVRHYYIAADEVDWNYAPLNYNAITGQPFDDEANVFVERGPHRIGQVYRKSLYREYTDATFANLKTVPAEWQHLGLLGPVIYAEVGDMIVVDFKNNIHLPASIHPHGVFYMKDSEGAPYADGTTGADKADDAVPHWHGQTLLMNEGGMAGMRTDMIELLPVSMKILDMLPDNPGTWLFHCHVNDHIKAGMVALFTVQPATAAQAPESSAATSPSAVAASRPVDALWQFYCQLTGRHEV